MGNNRVFSDANRAEGRLYRPVEPSDLVNIQQEKLKAFWYVGDDYRPAKIISIKYGINQKVGYLVSHGFGDGIETANIFVDVTPEKRYAIWAHKTQRFATNYFSSRQEAEIALQEMFGKYATPESQRKTFYVVEWEIKSDD